LVSEENEEPVTFDRAPETGKYVVVFDPLDGSSNIDVNVSVGTIFSIYRRQTDHRDKVHANVLQKGVQQVASGYVVYGASTILVYTAGRGVFAFTLDPEVGAFVLSHENLKMPSQGPYYSVNEAQSAGFPSEYQQFIANMRSGLFGRSYNSRYVGSLVADFHRTMLKGGVFMYPSTKAYPTGKLRLLYEANPLAFIAEQAGGMAVDGHQRILDIQPTDIHQRTPLVLGSRVEVEEFQKCCLPVEAVVQAR
ncbi:MAG: fructose-1,6-bisphosphatase, partial [Acidobacteriaceae bacterium]|nr:fructose-1,6-bisphosphatase [Acidobacteriaceae bacterium]